MTKKWLYFALKLAVSALLIGFIVANFDIGSSARRLKEMELILLLPAALLFLLLLLNNTVRWGIVMRAIEAPLGFAKTFRLLYIGIFFNQTLPSAVGGDAVRMYLARKEGLTLQGAINGVMLERVVTLIGLILLVVVTQPFLLERIGDNPAKYIFPAFAVLAVIGVVFLMLLDRIAKRFQDYKIVRWLANLAADTKVLFFAPALAAAGVALGVMGNILVAAMVYMLAMSLGLEVTLIDCLVLIPPVLLITTIPISIAGWGVREGAMVAGFALIGVAEGDAFALSILFGLVGIIVSIPGGLLWIAGGYRKSDIAEEAPIH